MAKSLQLNAPKVAESKSDNLESLSKVVKEVQLVNLCLKECTAYCADTLSFADDKVTRQSAFDVELGALGKKDNYFNVTCHLGVRELTEDSTDPKELVRVTASYQLTYQLTNRKGISKKDLQVFARINTPHNVWSYWREFVHNTTLRMGIAPIIIKLRPPVARML